MSLLEDQIIGCCSCIMLVCQQALSNILLIVVQLTCLLQDIFIDWNIMLANQNSFNRQMTVKPIELMISNLLQPKSLITRCQQSLEYIPRKGANIMWNLIIQRQYLFIKERSIRILDKINLTQKGKVPHIIAYSITPQLQRST